MTIQGEFVDPSSKVWRQVLRIAPHDFYHLPDYSQLAAGGDEIPLAFVAYSGAHRMLVPILKTPVPPLLAEPPPAYDAISPYGYPGPIWSTGAPVEFMRESLELLSSTMQAAQIVAGFFRLHPLLNRPEQFSGVGELVSHGPTVYIDLTLSEEDLWKQTRRGHRREILDLQKQGYVVNIDENWSSVDEFMLCYNQTMDRVNAKAFYYFPKAYFLRLREILGDRANLCLVRFNGEIACAGIATEVGGLAQYHLSATAHAHLHAHPSKLMLNFLRSWLKQRGNRVFHIGGGLGSLEDKLYLFKAGFSPLASEFRTWRLVTDPARYDTMLDRWARQSGRDPVHRHAFFPQYRASIDA